MDNKQKDTQKKRLVGAEPYIIGAVIGTVGALAINLAGYSVSDLLPSSSGIIWVGVFLAACAVFFTLHLILHEAGRLIAGKMSGYGFVSFRIFSFTLIKDNGKFAVKRFTMACVPGQCLMSPPEPIDGTYPYFFYNLSGGAVNILTACAAIIPAFMIESTTAKVLLLAFAAMGILVGATNIIPLKIDGAANGGHYIMTLGKSAEARRAFWLMLRINALLSEGQRLRDMPAEWFELPDEADINDAVTLATAYYRFCLLTDRHEFEQAKELGEAVLQKTDKMLELYKNEMRCELLFIEIIGECRKDEIDRLYTEELKKYIKATALLVSRQRLLYAYALLVTQDKAEAEKTRKQFEKSCAAHPYKGDAESEREIMNLIDKI